MKKLKEKGLLKGILIYWLPVVIWLLVIFAFSAHAVSKTSEVLWQDFVVKKTAHIIEYGILTVLFYRALVNSGVKKKEAAVYSVILAISYGVSDEIHQAFTPGREPRVRDILFDGLGSILFIYIIFNLLPKSPKPILKLAERLDLI